MDLCSTDAHKGFQVVTSVRIGRWQEEVDFDPVDFLRMEVV